GTTYLVTASLLCRSAPAPPSSAPFPYRTLFRSTLQVVEMRGAAQDDPVVLGVGGGEEVLVPMSQHAGVRALQHQGIHGRCIVACHAVPSSEMVWGPKLRPLCTANGKRCKLVLPGLSCPPTATEALRPGTRSQPAQNPP